MKFASIWCMHLSCARSPNLLGLSTYSDNNHIAVSVCRRESVTHKAAASAINTPPVRFNCGTKKAYAFVYHLARWTDDLSHKRLLYAAAAAFHSSSRISTSPLSRHQQRGVRSCRYWASDSSILPCVRSALSAAHNSSLSLIYCSVCGIWWRVFDLPDEFEVTAAARHCWFTEC